MSALRREAIWAAAVQVQLAALVLLTGVADLLERAGWFEPLFGALGDQVLLPAWAALLLLVPVFVGMIFVWGWQLAHPVQQPPRPAGLLVHGAGALLGSLLLLAWLSTGTSHEGRVSPWIVLPAVPLAALASCLLYAPRLAFPRLRAV